MEQLAARFPDFRPLRGSFRRVAESCLRPLPAVARNREDTVRPIRGDLASMSAELLDERRRDLDRALCVRLGTPIELGADLDQAVLWGVGKISPVFRTTDSRAI